jgi:ribosome-binding factor A
MSGRRGGKGGGKGGRSYPRSARVGETLREIIAEELVRIDDERLSFVTVTGIDVDPELNRAIVYYDSLAGEAGDDEIL